MPDIIDIPIEKIKEQVLQRPVSQQGIEQLANSIKAVGILSPLLVVQHQETFHLIAGQRRLLAAGIIHLPTVPCIVVPVDQEKALAMSLHENLFREDLTAADEANLFAYLRDKLAYSGEKIAKLISKSGPYVSQRLALLTWDPQLVQGIKDRTISFSVARELSQVHDVQHRRYLIKHAIAQGINYRTASSWVKQWKAELIPAPLTKEEEGITEPHYLQTHVMCDCFWCEKSVPIEKVCNVIFCDECFKELKMAKSKSRQKT